MTRLLISFKILLVVMALTFIVGGCSAMQTNKQQAAMQPDTPDGPMAGPGLFTGEDDGFTIFKR